jgi:3-deoxy-D-manno-octulosonate 8-phosphate phosphatase (KDO 8-P phosphatase)
MKLPQSKLMRRLANIKLLTLDVDGVLTDGGLYYTEKGVLLRRFNVKDGQGIKRVMALGVTVALVSAGPAQSIRQRGEDLGIPYVYAGVGDKLARVKKLCRKIDLSLSNTAHVGDDLNDLPLMQAISCPLTVADAVPEVLEAAVYVTRRGGGAGAVREICDLIAVARGK